MCARLVQFLKQSSVAKVQNLRWRSKKGWSLDVWAEDLEKSNNEPNSETNWAAIKMAIATQLWTEFN